MDYVTKTHYSLKPHQRRKLLEMAKKATSQAPNGIIERPTIKVLAGFFKVSLKTVVEALDSAKFPLDAVEKSTAPAPAPEPEKSASKPLLTLAGIKAPPATPSQILKADLQALAHMESELLLRKSQLDMQQNRLTVREDELLQKERLVEQDRLDLELALHALDAEDTPRASQDKINTLTASLAEAQEALTRFEAGLPRNSKPKAVGLISMGAAKQWLDSEIMPRDAKIAALQEALRSVLETGGITKEWTAQEIHTRDRKIAALQDALKAALGIEEPAKRAKPVRHIRLAVNNDYDDSLPELFFQSRFDIEDRIAAAE